MSTPFPSTHTVRVSSGSVARLRAFAKKAGGVVTETPYWGTLGVDVEAPASCGIMSANLLPDGRVSGHVLRDGREECFIVDMAQFLRDLRGLTVEDQTVIMATESRRRMDRARSEILSDRRVRMVV